MAVLFLYDIASFFFSSRRRHTRYWRDWSSNVCSSDLNIGHGTRMAGIIGAKGKNREVIGAAPDCEFVVVKLKTDQQEEMESNGKFNFKKVPVYNGVNIITGIKYLFNTAKKYERSEEHTS